MNNTERREYVAQLIEKYLPNITWLEPDEVPSVEEVRTWLTACTTTRGGFRLIKKPRKDADETVRAMFERLRWHKCIPGGTYTLWGPMGSLMRTDAKTYAKIDAFATMISVMCGKYEQSGDHPWVELLAPHQQAESQ